MEILFVTPEIAPYSRSGEIGDVCASLPKALRSLGHRVTVVSPLWSSVNTAGHTLARRLSGVDVQLGSERFACTLFDGRTTGGVELLFVAQAELFGSASGASESEAGLRAAIGFAQAVAGIAESRSPTPEVVHAHGFFAAGALPLCASALPKARRVLSLYDERARGVLGPLRELLPPALQSLGDEAEASLLRLGIEGAERVIARSQGAAVALAEADGGPLGAGLAAKLTGVAHGLDASRWNPMTDALLPARFDAMSPAGKTRCKAQAQHELGLPVRADAALFVCVLGESAGGRALLAAALPAVLRNDVQVLLVGEADAALSALAERFGDRLALTKTRDERSVHRALAAADLLLVPEHAAEHGDLHLVGQRYGSVPVAPNVQPIADALVDCDAGLTTGSGFLFEAGVAQDLAAAAQRAVSGFASQVAFAELRKRVMRLDLSWERAARHYEHAYRNAPSQAAA